MSPPDLTAELEGIVSATAPDALPALLGALEQAKAKAWARLTTPSPPTRREAADRHITPDEPGAAVGGTPARSPKRLHVHTRVATLATDTPPDQRHPPATPQPTPAPPIRPTVDLCRSRQGDAQRTYLQELVKRFAESKGYRATVNEPALGGTASVDVALDLEGRRIACEISVTSTADYELKHVAKCLAAGFDEVVVIVPDKKEIAKLREALAAGIPAEQRKRVRVMRPDQFFLTLDPTGQPAPEMKTVRGYRVKVTYGAPPDDEAMRIRAITETVVGALKRLKKT